jgi:hypothetical protein
VHDSVGPRLSTAATSDSLSATLTFTQPLDPAQRFGPGTVRVLLLPDSAAVEVVSLLPKTVHDSIYKPPPPPPDTMAPKPVRPPVDSTRPAGETTLPSRAPLFTTLLLRVAQPWKPGSTYVVEIDSLRNANRAAANIRGPLEVPVPKVDTTAAAVR